jgi:hypothetical protein
MELCVFGHRELVFDVLCNGLDVQGNFVSVLKCLIGLSFSPPTLNCH